jgi:hypothetical protein
MAKPPKPDYDERFSLNGMEPEDVAELLVNTPSDEELDRAEAEMEPEESETQA